MDVQLGVAALEIPGAITADAVAQDEILRTRGRADRIGLHECEPIEGPLQRRWWEETARDGKRSQVPDLIAAARPRCTFVWQQSILLLIRVLSAEGRTAR